MKKALLFGASTIFALPMVAFAATAISDLNSVGTWFITFVNGVLVPVLFALAFIVFIWGAFTTFILGATSEETKDKGKNLMLWGLIGFFVMISVWGLVNILTGTFSLNSAVVQPTATGLR